jgi:hypothetical protein
LESPGITLASLVVPMFTSMFLHGGWMHLIGNMWFLFIGGFACGLLVLFRSGQCDRLHRWGAF